MIFAIDIGHNCPPHDTGAVQIKKEDSLTLAVGTRVINQLRSLGHIVVETKPSKADHLKQSLAKRCQTANEAKVDRFVSIHFNSFNAKAHGTEVYALGAMGKAIALRVLTEICKLGFFNRGVKEIPVFYVIRNTNAPAILVECCFVDSERDMALFDVDKMAIAIVRGLTEDEIQDQPSLLVA